MEFMLLPAWAQDGVSEEGSRSGYWNERTTQMLITINPHTYLALYSLQTLSTWVISCNPYNSFMGEAFFR